MNRIYTFGKTLRELRQNKNITQSRLAELLGVTAQSVSKWENDVGFPDILLLAPLADILGVTTDYLLGTGRDVKEAEITAAKEKWDALWREERDTGEECIALWRNLLKKYPTDNICRYHLGFELICTDEPDKIREGCTLHEAILDDCTDGKLRGDAISGLIFAYGKLGETALAVKLAKTSVMPYASMPSLMTKIKGNPDEGHWHQYMIWECLSHLAHHMSSVPCAREEDRIFTIRKAIEVIECVCYDRPHGYFDAYNMIALRRELCSRLAGLGQFDGIFEEIRKMIETAKRCDELPLGRHYFDGNMFLDSVYHDHTLPYCEVKFVREELEEARYDPIREDERFRELYALLDE